jgi:hypothetical protein
MRQAHQPGKMVGPLCGTNLLARRGPPDSANSSGDVRHDCSLAGRHEPQPDDIMRPMQLPDNFRGLKWATILVGLYAAVWIALEGSLGRVVALAFGITLLIAGHIGQRIFGGRTFSLVGWLFVAGLSGLFTGLGVGLLTLVLMGLKSGLHAHGPEFRPEQIEWVLSRIPLWSAAGLLVGLGLGLLSAEWQKQV